MTTLKKISSAIFILERKPIRLPTLLGNCYSNASSTKDKEEILLKEKAVPVSKETIEQPSTEVAPAEKPEFTTGAPSYETSANDNQLKTDSNTDKKPVSRVLIEM